MFIKVKVLHMDGQRKEVENLVQRRLNSYEGVGFDG